MYFYLINSRRETYFCNRKVIYTRTFISYIYIYIYIVLHLLYNFEIFRVEKNEEKITNSRRS